MKRHSVIFPKIKKFYKVYLAISGIVAFLYQWDSTVDRVKEIKDALIAMANGAFSFSSLFPNIKGAIIGFLS